MPVKFHIATESGSTLVTLTGLINEGSEPYFQDLCASLPAASASPLQLDCFGIEYINSTGVVQWLQFLTQLGQSGHTYEFRRCSPTFVDYCVIFPRFAAHGKIRSVALPFSCDSCGESALEVAEMAGIEAFAAASKRCARCGGPLTSDGLLDDVLTVLAKANGV
jgi:anti-anti-sigma regulatory factor